MDLRLWRSMQAVLFIAKLLSGAVIAALGAALVDLWRRAEVPSFSYGALRLSQRRLKALWLACLLGALGVASNNDPIIRVTDDHGTPAPSAADIGPSATYSLTLPFPFYRYERMRRVVSGAMVEEHVLEGIVIPWALLWALLSYFVLVVRWNPDSRWARRILEGKKART